MVKMRTSALCQERTRQEDRYDRPVVGADSTGRSQSISFRRLRVSASLNIGRQFPTQNGMSIFSKAEVQRNVKGHHAFAVSRLNDGLGNLSRRKTDHSVVNSPSWRRGEFYFVSYFFAIAIDNPVLDNCWASFSSATG
jgi:hypothetical protein